MNKLLTKTLALSFCGVLSLSTIGLVACGNNEDTIKFSVCNVSEYIFEGFDKEFEDYYYNKTGKKIQLDYEEVDTPEDIDNKMKSGSVYDVICPSDYMIEKLAREGRLQKIDLGEGGNYNTYASPYIKNVFDNISWTNSNGETEKLSEYAGGYMWGTLGLVYNPEKVEANDMKSWSILWESKYSKKFSVKDSVRDTYFIGLAKFHETELKNNTDYENLKALFNDTKTETINSVKDVLIDLKKNSRGLEVDEGKNDIVTGAIDINFQWSGDAVYAMEVANDEEKPVALEYSVPEEGSNVWFDGWCVPKNAKNVDVAIEFINFLSNPETAIKNMDEIGYVSCVGGEDVFEWVNDTYGVENGQFDVDLGYFFGENAIVKTDKQGVTYRMFTAQYPEKTIIDRCVVMNYFPSEANEKITEMWLSVKNS